MRRCALIVAASLVFISQTAVALPRRPLAGPPKIARGVVERFLIFREQLFLSGGAGLFSGIAALQGGVLVPVSEDRDGIYYQNLKGVWIYNQHYRPITRLHPKRRELPGIWYRGGLYFSKTKAEDVYAYKGDARIQDAYLEREWRRVPASALAHLRIGHVAKGAKKSGR